MQHDLEEWWRMRYEAVDDLPQGIREFLPDHAQEDYRLAFNNAYDEEENGQRAHEIAWRAVEDKYNDEGAHQWRREIEQSAKDSTPIPWQPFD
jgi:cation transport regulator